MKQLFIPLIIAIALPFGASSAGTNPNFGTDDAKYQAETAELDQHQAVSKNNRKQQFGQSVIPNSKGQHSLRDPYNNPTVIMQDLYR